MSETLEVVAVIRAKPGSEAAVGEAMAALVEPTKSEEGCLEYRLFTSAVDPTAFVTIERWRGQADLDAHMRTPHIRAAISAFDGQLAEPPAIHPLIPS